MGLQYVLQRLDGSISEGEEQSGWKNFRGFFPPDPSALSASLTQEFF